MSRTLRWAALVATVAAISVVLAWLGVPSPPLFGGLLGALAFTLTGSHTLALPRGAFLVAQGIIGLTVAAQVDWEALQAFGSDWPAILIVTIGTLVISAVAGQPLRWYGVNSATATFSSIAGGASGMTALADDLGADARVVTVIQYMRVLIILLTLPAVVATFFSPEHASVASLAKAGPSMTDYAFVVLAVGLGIAFGIKVAIPSPGVLGTLIVGIAFALTPLFSDSVVPSWVQSGAFVLIGAQVGLRFTRQSLAAIGRMLPVAVVVIVGVIVACAGLGVLLAKMTGETALDSYLATTPGGLPAVLATSTETSGNVTFVTAVQLIRLLLVLLLAPVVARLLLRSSKTP